MSAMNSRLRLGTCSWTAKGWSGSFYPAELKRDEYITEYARRYDTVEIDSTFYGTPKSTTVEVWRDKTPENFLFATKAPKAITHDKFLRDCKSDLKHYLDTMSVLGDKLGPILFQFPYYAKRSGMTQEDFLETLKGFLPSLPEGFRFAVEVRNKTWLDKSLFEILRSKNIACCLIDHPWMAPPQQLFDREGIVTADFSYLRWLGDRKGIEKITKTFNESVVERTKDLANWVAPIKNLLDEQVDMFGYVNNHYGGYAPDNVDALHAHLADDREHPEGNQ